MATTFQPANKNIRETACSYVNWVDGKPETSEIRVQYYSWSTADFKRHEAERQAILKADPEAIMWNADVLAKRLHALPDLIDPETNEPVKITAVLLDAMDVDNINAIREAINADLAPKSEPAK